MSNAKTIIACRPGMKQAMESAFAGMKVIVDDKLDKDYEFREEAMSLEELMEAELSKEEKQDADPKNAITFIVPMVHHSDNLEANVYAPTFLAIRLERGPSQFDVMEVIKATEPIVMGNPDFINNSATAGALKAAFKKAGFNVLSISEADGLCLMKEI